MHSSRVISMSSDKFGFLSITAPPVNENVKVHRSTWRTFSWRIQICNKKLGFLFKLLMSPTPIPPPGSGGSRVWYHWIPPFVSSNFRCTHFFILCIVLEIFQCLQINRPPCIYIGVQKVYKKVLSFRFDTTEITI